jgi:hypothetical protein
MLSKCICRVKTTLREKQSQFLLNEVGALIILQIPNCLKVQILLKKLFASKSNDCFLMTFKNLHAFA